MNLHELLSIIKNHFFQNKNLQINRIFKTYLQYTKTFFHSCSNCWPVQAPSSLFPFKNEHYFDTSGSWNHQGFVHRQGDKESLRNTASKVAFWRVSRNPTIYCPKSMKFGYLFPWKTRGKRVSPRALLKSSKMMSKNHQSGDRRKTNFSTAIMTIIWTPLSL